MSNIYDWMKDSFTLLPNIILDYFGQLNITSDEFVLITYLLTKSSQGEVVDELEGANLKLGWTQVKLMEVINSLMNKQYLSLELKPNAVGRQTDHYSLRPFFEFLDTKYYQKNEAKAAKGTLNEGQILVSDFEKEFSRTLSPLELEKLASWIHKDGFKAELIKIALREAVIHQALSFNYIDRILLNWKKKNIRTVIQAEKEIQAFQNKSFQKQAGKQEFQEFHIPIIDWAKGD